MDRADRTEITRHPTRFKSTARILVMTTLRSLGLEPPETSSQPKVPDAEPSARQPSRWTISLMVIFGRGDNELIKQRVRMTVDSYEKRSTGVLRSLGCKPAEIARTMGMSDVRIYQVTEDATGFTWYQSSDGVVEIKRRRQQRLRNERQRNLANHARESERICNKPNGAFFTPETVVRQYQAEQARKEKVERRAAVKSSWWESEKRAAISRMKVAEVKRQNEITQHEAKRKRRNKQAERKRRRMEAEQQRRSKIEAIGRSRAESCILEAMGITQRKEQEKNDYVRYFQSSQVDYSYLDATDEELFDDSLMV